MGRPFDEVFADDGQLRPAYRALRRRAGHDVLRPKASTVERLRDRPLSDDTRILPVPLVLDDNEYRGVLAAGTAQRARALQRLFHDLVLGRQRVLQAGLGLTPAVVDELLTPFGTDLAGLRRLWRAEGRDSVRFVYGPDLVRDPSGRWQVLEDNVGCVGGTADAHHVLRAYRSAADPAGVICSSPPDLALAVRNWLGSLGRNDAVAVLGHDGNDDPWAFQVDENSRRRSILEQLPVPVVDRTALGSASVVVNFDVDLSWAREFQRPDVALLNAPGTGVLGSKALLTYMDDVIRFYTGAQPILDTPLTRRLEGTLPPDPAGWVAKSVAGCQGSDVIVLARRPAERAPDVVNRLGPAVLQRYVEPSRISPSGGWDGYRVELRPMCYVLGWDDVQVGELPVGKAVSDFDARRLNNISGGACYLAVLREPCPWCSR